MNLSQLGETVRAVDAQTTVQETARIMVRDGIGAVLVRKEADGPISGIVTDRDLVKLIAQGVDPSRETLEAFAGVVLRTDSIDATRAELTHTMRVNGVRRLPLVDEHGDVQGIVSLDDLLIELSQEIFDLGRAIRVEMRQEAPVPDADE